MIDDTKLNSDDELFLKELEMIFIRFVDSDKEQFNLEPMNSYKRRLPINWHPNLNSKQNQ